MPDENVTSTKSTSASEGLLFTYYTITELHAGAGESSNSVVDLAIQREKHTEYPVVYSSSMKGSLRCFFEKYIEADVYAIFGKEGDEGNSGKVVFTDAKILLFPVRSSQGVFKWVTSKFILERLLRDLRFLDIHKRIDLNAIPSGPAGHCSSKVYTQLILEDYVVDVADGLPADVMELMKCLTSSFFPEATLEDRLIVVSDDLFKSLVKHATLIIARNKLQKETKKSENLWYEEVVPPDAVFYTTMKPAFPWTGAPNQNPMNQLCEGIKKKILQIGGNETIGYGFVRMSSNLVPEAKGLTITSSAADAMTITSPGGGTELAMPSKQMAQKVYEKAVELNASRVFDRTCVDFLKGLPTMFQQLGLGQTVAFLDSKKKGANYYGKILGVFDGLLFESATPGDLTSKVLSTDLGTYHLEQERAMEYAEWLKKFALAFYKEAEHESQSPTA